MNGYRYRGEALSPSEIRRAGLLTVEGEKDDIAAPGQTYAAHALCTGIPKQLHQHLLVPGGGHFSLFHGTRWRSTVLPAVIRFFERTELPGAVQWKGAAGEPCRV